MQYHAVMKEAQKLANESVFEPGHVQRWNALEDTLLGKMSLADVEALRAHCETMPCMGAGVILSMLP